MKNYLLIILVVLFSRSNAQSLVDSISSTGFSLNESIAERLSALAVNNRKVEIAEKSVQGAKLEVERSKANIFNNITFSSNFNEYSINSTIQGVQNFFYPRYNLGLSLPFGYITTQAKQVKIAKSNLEKSTVAKQLEIEDIKNAIKIQYELYLANKYFLALHETLLQDQKILLDKIAVSFENNQIDLDTFSAANRSFNDVLIKKINLIKDLNTSKYQLENLLGMKLEDAYKKIGL